MFLLFCEVGLVRSNVFDGIWVNLFCVMIDIWLVLEVCFICFFCEIDNEFKLVIYRFELVSLLYWYIFKNIFLNILLLIFNFISILVIIFVNMFVVFFVIKY